MLIYKPPWFTCTTSSNELSPGSTRIQDWLQQQKYTWLIDGGTQNLVHRLDKCTSGILVLGTGPAGRTPFLPDLAGRKWVKVYDTLVYGELPRSHWVGVIAGRIKDTWRGSRVSRSHRAREAETWFQATELLQCSSGAKFTRLRCCIHTGRRHQIRVHMRHLGRRLLRCNSYGVVGDDRYAKPPKQSSLRCNRIFLHHARLELPFPSGGGKVNARCPLPEDMCDVLSALTPSRANDDLQRFRKFLKDTEDEAPAKRRRHAD